MTAPQRRAGIVAALLAVPTLVLASPAVASTTEGAPSVAAEGAVEPGQLTGGQIVKKGWWSRSNQPPPETGVLAPPSVPALAAPKGSLPVADVGGDPERIAALEIALDGKKDSTVDSVVVALREVADPTANPNSAAAAIVACPITESFWVAAENGPWETAPTYDCKVGSVKGVRDDKGVWRFDLTALAMNWLASDAVLPPAVVLVTSSAALPEGDPAAATAPSNFQVAYDAAQGLGLLAKVTAPVKNDDDDEDNDNSGNSDNDDTGGDDPGDTSGGGGSGTPSSGGGGGILDMAAGGGDVGLDTGAAPAPGGAPALEDSAAAEEEVTEAGAPVLAPVAAPAWHDGLGRGALFMLPLALLLAYACMLALGPAGQPVAGQGRRGVSRALDRLRAAGTAAMGQGNARS